MKVIKLIGLCVLGLAIGCNRPPKGVLSHDEMVDLMIDIHKGESVVDANPRSFPTDSTRKAFRQSLYAKHGLTTEMADSTFAWYGYHMEEYIEVCDDVVKRLEEELAQAQATAGASAGGLNNTSISIEGDSVDVWPGVRFRDFGPLTPTDVVPFTIESDANWELGDVYILRFKRLNGNASLNVAMAAEYGDSRREYVSTTVSGDGWQTLTFPLNPDIGARTVHGYILAPAADSNAGSIDSLSLVRMRWSEKFRHHRNNIKEFRRETKHNVE